MRYVLNNNIALRSWQLVPCAYYVHGFRYARQLSREVFEALLKCDGYKELESSELLNQLQLSGFIHEAMPNERWSAWSKPRFCDNRYFPSVN